MRIMYLLFSFSMGGTERLVADICNQVVKENEVHLYIVNDLYSKELLETVDDKVIISLQNRKVGSSKKDALIAISNYIKSNKIEVVHCNSFNAPELLLIAKIMNPKIKIIHTIHGMEQYRTINSLRKIYRNVICDYFVAISESVKDDIIADGANKKKVKVVYNAIDTGKFTRKKEKIYDKNKIVIGNVARINCAEKGQDILLNAVNKVIQQGYNIECYFAGPADQAHQKELEGLKQQVKDFHIENKVHFIGNVNNVSAFLEGIDIFILPSRLEGFGISLIEAMNMGIPCIASNLYGPAELIGNDERGLLFVSCDADDLAKKIAMVVDNYEASKKKAQDAVVYVNNNFRIDNMCKKLLEIYSL